MRASMSVPGVISPVEIDGTLYVDGGLLQNVPVAAAREACADVVIAVNVGSSLLTRAELNTAFGVSLQMINLLMEQNVRASIASLGADDVLIQPELGDFGSANFAEGLSLVENGEAAAREKADVLRRFSVSEAQYREWRDNVRSRLPAVPQVTDVTVATRSERVSPLVIERELAEVPGIDLRRRPETDFSLENFNDRLEQVYGRGDFERMDYRVIDRQGVRTLEVQGVEKSWGPNYVKFGLGLAADSEQTRFNAALSHRSTWLNSMGAEWRNDIQYGHRDFLASEFFQPLSLRAGAFVAPRLELQDEPIVYYINGRRIGDYRVKYARVHLDAGAQNKFGEFRVGAFTGMLDAEPDFGFVPLVPEFDITQVGYTARFIYDQIDNPRFARDGILVVLDSFGTVSGWGSDDEYNKTSLLMKGAKSFGRHAIEFAGWYGLGIKGDLPAYDPFLLGGFLQGSGYRMDELVGDEVALIRGVYTYELAALPAPIGRGVYFGASLEATRATLGVDTGGPKKFRPSASLFLAADTFLGPAFLAWGRSFDDDGDGALYFMLGTP
jgi:NTE family protein